MSSSHWKFLFIGLLFINTANADTRRVWEDKPLSLVLPIGQEVRVTFPTDVDIQVPLAVSEKLTSLAPNSRMIYWTPSDAFPSGRILATAKDGHTVYVIDLSADKSTISTSDSQSGEESETLEDPAEIILTRFASQSLYAPTRLVPSDARIAATKIKPLDKNFPLLQSGHGEIVSVNVVGAWTGFSKFVTAVLIVNQSPITFEFDASRVRGNFTHITAQHLRIGPKSTLTDRTTLYLISDVPFAEAVTEDSYAY
jgi:integrating conjugative element protein (TIGR03749 family)